MCFRCTDIMDRQIGKCYRIDPSKSPHTYGHLAFKRGSNGYLNQDGPFNKWYWNKGESYEEKYDIRSPTCNIKVKSF